MQAAGDRERLAANAQRPYDLLVAEVFGHAHGEHAPIAPRLEVRRLSLIRIARSDEVVRTNRNLERLLHVPIVVAERDAVRAVRILVPALERRRDAEPRRLRRRQRKLRGQTGDRERQTHGRDESRSHARTFRPPPSHARCPPAARVTLAALAEMLDNCARRTHISSTAISTNAHQQPGVADDRAGHQPKQHCTSLEDGRVGRGRGARSRRRAESDHHEPGRPHRGARLGVADWTCDIASGILHVESRDTTAVHRSGDDRCARGDLRPPHEVLLAVRRRRRASAGVVMQFLAILGAAVAAYVLSSIRVLTQYERGVVFFLGKFKGTHGPGVVFVPSILARLRRVSLRVVVLDIPPQDVITRDNISVKVNAVLYFRVSEPSLAVIEVQDYLHATMQLAQTTLLSVLGQVELDELLADRRKANEILKESIDERT